MVSTLPGYVTAEQAAKELGVDVSQVCRYCRGDSQVQLPAVKIGNTWFIRRSDLKRFKRPDRGNPLLKK